MSVQFKKEDYMEKINEIYSQPNIDIISWNGYTGPLTYFCYKCSKEHSVTDARNLLSTSDYCKKDLGTNKKFSKEDFLSRINKLHSRKIEVVSYTGLSNPFIYICPECGEQKTIKPARMALSKFSLCDDCDGVEKEKVLKKITEIFKDNPKYELLSYHGVKNKSKIKCLKCGAIFERYPTNIIQCPDTCPECNSAANKSRLDTSVVQTRLDEEFGAGLYTILDYQGQLKSTTKIKCNNCGLIFNTRITTFIDGSRGCPKCKRFKSKGERLVEKYLQENNIKFEAQKRYKECNNKLSSFDFCAYDINGIEYLIEVNGEQHYKDIAHLGGLEDNQRRDKIKKNFCLTYNKNLIIIPYTDLTYEKIDNYLSFLKVQRLSLDEE